MPEAFDCGGNPRARRSWPRRSQPSCRQRRSRRQGGSCVGFTVERVGDLAGTLQVFQSLTWECSPKNALQSFCCLSGLGRPSQSARRCCWQLQLRQSWSRPSCRRTRPRCWLHYRLLGLATLRTSRRSTSTSLDWLSCWCTWTLRMTPLLQ